MSCAMPITPRISQRRRSSGAAPVMELTSDLKQTDIPFLVFVLTELAQLAREVSPEIWRRYLALVLDGLRPEREGVTPLPVPALRPEELEMAMRQNAPRHH